MMDEIEYYEMQEQNAIGQVIAACAKAIFDAYGAETMGQLQRHIYRYTDCGAAVSFELHEGACGYEDDSTEAPIGIESARKSLFVYCGDERAYKITEPWLVVRQIGVSSIVEGVDQTTGNLWLDLKQYADDSQYEGDLPDLAERAVKDFDKLINETEAEARSIWNDTHGCPTCAKHLGIGEGDDGATPVWDKCPDCKGHGNII